MNIPYTVETRPDTGLNNGKRGIWLFLASEVMLFGALFSGAQEMQFATDVPLQLSSVLLAVILLLVTATRLVELIVGKRARVLAADTRLERGLGS